MNKLYLNLMSIIMKSFRLLLKYYEMSLSIMLELSRRISAWRLYDTSSGTLFKYSRNFDDRSIWRMTSMKEHVIRNLEVVGSVLTSRAHHFTTDSTDSPCFSFFARFFCELLFGFFDRLLSLHTGVNLDEN